MGARAHIIIAAMAATLTASAATAQCVGSCTTATIYEGNSGVIQLPVTATVGGRCGFSSAPSATLDYPNFDVVEATQSAPFVLDCTGPSRVAVTSLNGGLLNNSGSLPSGYVNLASYTVNLRLTPTSGSQVTLAQACPVEVLKATGPASGSAACAEVRGTASFNGNVGLRLGNASSGQSSFIDVKVGPSTINPAAGLLVNGDYSDTLTVTVAASL
jgi:hypothetical protein